MCKNLFKSSYKATTDNYFYFLLSPLFFLNIFCSIFLLHSKRPWPQKIHYHQNIASKKPRRGEKLFPLFIIELPKNETSPEIYNLRSLFQIRITIVKFRVAEKANQCPRCQKFFYIAANCNICPRCVACNGDHLSTDCPSKKALELELTRPPPKCNNCVLSHPSIYKGCKNIPAKKQYKT